MFLNSLSVHMRCYLQIPISVTALHLCVLRMNSLEHVFIVYSAVFFLDTFKYLCVEGPPVCVVLFIKEPVSRSE